MIKLYSGTPGSGKSLHQARDVYYDLKFGRPVIANYEISREYAESAKGNFTCVDNDELTPDFLVRYARRYWQDHGGKVIEGRIKLYIDECQLKFNAREWAKSDRAKWLKFFTLHRKFGYDIIMVAQYDRMIDRQIRSLIEYEYVHRKASNFGAKGRVLGLIAGGSAYVCVKVWYPLRLKVGSEWIKPRKKFFALYDTYMIFDDDFT